MSYIRAEQILPRELIEMIQSYVDGENIYIPRKDNKRRECGDGTEIRQELENRNRMICCDFSEGLSVQELAVKYYLSIKSIQRILRMRNDA